jgi:hypothetical protein
MGITLTLALLGLCLGFRIRSRIGAAFLCFSAVVVFRVLIEASPRLLGQSAWGRQMAAAVGVVDQHTTSMLHMTVAAIGGLVVAALLQLASTDHRWESRGPGPRRLRRLV